MVYSFNISLIIKKSSTDNEDLFNIAVELGGKTDEGILRKI